LLSGGVFTVGLRFWLIVVAAFIGFKIVSFFADSYSLNAAAPPEIDNAPNELTSLFCADMKVMAKQVKEGRNVGMTQSDYLSMIADSASNFSDSRNIDQVTRVSEAVVKGAWMSNDDPAAYSEFVHETCLDTISLVP